MLLFVPVCDIAVVRISVGMQNLYSSATSRFLGIGKT